MVKTKLNERATVPFLFATICCCLSAESTTNSLCIDPDTALTDYPSCTAVVTMDQLCTSVVFTDNTIITFLPGTHKLDKVCTISDVSNLVISVLTGSEIVVECSSTQDSGLRFFNVNGITISGLTFKGCGASWNFSVAPAVLTSAATESALFFNGGSSLSITNLTLLDSKTAGMYIYDVGSTVTVDNSKFAGASINSPGVLGGNLIVYDSNIAGPIAITITNSTILKNGESTSGLSLFLGNPALSVNIMNTSFLQNMGGNLVVHFYSSSVATLSCVSFIAGHSNYGGGLNVEYHKNLSASSSVYTPFLRVINSTFRHNIALKSGGGIYAVTSADSGNILMQIENVTFKGNSAYMGGLAILADEGKNNILQFNISNCKFSDHNSQSADSFSSVLFVQNVSSFLAIDEVTMEFNNCTAIKAIDSSMYYSNSTRISHNTALAGAGLQLTNSVIYFVPGAQLAITDNFAQETGGGIQIYDCPGCNFFTSNTCFFQNSLPSANFTISNNHALQGGDNIFGITEGCDNAQYHVPQNEPCRPSSISSSPQELCVATHGENECRNETSNKTLSSTSCSNHYNATIYPGGEVTVFLHLIGQSNGTVPGTVSANTQGSATIADDDEKSQLIKLSGTNVTYTVYSRQARSMNQASIVLIPVHGCLSVSCMAKAEITVIFKDCPLGFNAANVDGSNMFGCQCDSNSAITTCSIRSQTITKKMYSWVGMFQKDNQSYLATNDNCPLDYCNPAVLSIVSLPDSLEQDEQCQYNRSGILCGSCPEGWSLVLGSSECHEKCSNVWLLLIIPFALAGLLLVVVIHSLNLTVTMGTVCGLIFYANVVQDYSLDILSKHHPIPGLTPILQVFLSWLNLDLGISTCFYSEMEAFGKAFFLFVFPIYIWMISATIIVLSNRYIFFTRLFGANSLKVLSTLILLSYSKMLRVSLGALNVKSVLVRFSSSNSSSMLRWALDGNISYLDPQKHLALFLFAMLFIALLFPFSLSLLCVRHIYSLSNWFKVCSWIDQLKPFFDTYIGPYKDNTSFWTGLLLLVRLFLLIMRTVDFKNGALPYYIIIAVCLFLSAIMISLQGVYKKHWFNILEYFFIINLCLVFLISSYEDGSKLWISVLSHILVSSAFLVFLGILAYHMYLKFHCYGRSKSAHQVADVEPNMPSSEDRALYEPLDQLETEDQSHGTNDA